MWYTYSSFIKEGVEWETVMLNETGHVTEIVPLRIKASLVAQTVKNLPAMQETQVQSQDWKDPLEMEKATCSTPLFLPGKSHRQRSFQATIHGATTPWATIHGVTKSWTQLSN